MRNIEEQACSRRQQLSKPGPLLSVLFKDPLSDQPFGVWIITGGSGATENAGVENTGALKMPGWKTREWKSWHHNAGVENAGVEIAAP